MILDTVRIEILYEEPGIGPGRLVPVDIKTAHIDSEDLLEVLRVLLRIERYGSLDLQGFLKDQLSLPAPADPSGVKNDKLSPKSKTRSQKIVKKTKGSSKTMQCPYCEITAFI